jgi:hypothetical protein
MTILQGSDDFRRATGMFPSLVPLATVGNEITAIAVTIGGISGGTVHDRAPVNYRILASVRGLATQLPEIWIAQPENRQIRHMNVFQPNAVCPFTGDRLPTLCWGSSGVAWRNTPAPHRRLANLLEAVRQVLADANPNSRAR